MRSNDFGPAMFNHEISGPWAKAIEEATAYAFVFDDKRYHQPGAISSLPGRFLPLSMGEGIERVDRSLIFLDELQVLLEQQEHKECAPLNPSEPPPFLDGHEKDADSKPPASGTPKEDNKKRAKKKASAKKSKNGKNQFMSKNRYAMIALDSEDDSSGSCNSGNDSVIYDSIIGKNIGPTTINDDRKDSKPAAIPNIETNLSAEAHPYVPSPSFGEDDDYGHIPRLQPSNQHRSMDTMRLLIRLYASQSDLHAKKARLLAVQRRWLLGASSLQLSFIALAKGLELADKAISAVVAAVDTGDVTGWTDYASNDAQMHGGVPSTIAVDTRADHRRAQLEKDAEITSVSSNYLAIEKDRYIRLAHAKVEKLKMILDSTWKSRDAAKKRIGVGKWKSNKQHNSKSYFTQTREQHEEELQSLEEALCHLQDTVMATSSLMDEASKLRETLKQIRFAKNRNNGYRPKPHSRHSPQTVMGYQLPEPSYMEQIAKSCGWTFTGGIGGQDCVQFFERWMSVGFHDPAAAISQNNDLPDWSISGYDPNNPDSSNFGAAEVTGSFVKAKLDFYLLTGAVQAVVEYPITYNDEGVMMQPAWTSTMQMILDKENVDSLANFHQILIDPLTAVSIHGGTNVANLHS